MLCARMHLAALKSLGSVRRRLFCTIWIGCLIITSCVVPDRLLAHPLVSVRPLQPGSETDMIEKMDGAIFEAEGVATFIHSQANTLEMELKTATSPLQIEVTDSSGISPILLLNSRLRCRGTGQIAWTLEGQEVAAILRVTNRMDIEILEAAPKLWDSHPPVSIGEVTTNLIEPEDTILRMIGRVVSIGPERVLMLGDENFAIRVETLETNSWPVGESIEVLGRTTRTAGPLVLDSAICRRLPHDGAAGHLPPVLTSAGTIKQLKREEARKGYQVKLRGVITCVQPEFKSFVIQDSTMGVFVRNWPATDASPPKVGDYCEVEGNTVESFAPDVRSRKMVRLGKGMLPTPVHATWDQLMAGSLDTQYVEVQGIVNHVQRNRISLFTRGGSIWVDLFGLESVDLRVYEHALVTLRGCLYASHEPEGEGAFKVKVGEIKIHGAMISVDEPAPTDMFAVPVKHAKDLLHFDSRAGAFQRIKVIGQIVHERRGEYYLMDEKNGLKFTLERDCGLKVGDLAEVVGFPNLSGPSPVLQQCLARAIGRQPLPPSSPLEPGKLISPDHDSTVVHVEGLLVGLSQQKNETILELQAGVHTFAARLESRNPSSPLSVPIGARLQLTGVYHGIGGNRAEGRALDSFELLLRSPTSIVILARPPWWTLERLLIALGSLMTILVLVLIWTSLLSRKVTQRTAQLEQEIRERERAEHQHSLEEERSRIARDLHDDLGSSLTEISMLAETGRDCPDSQEPGVRFDRILSRANSLVRALDEIVWAVDPRKDTVAALVHYLAGFAEDYLQTVGLTCRVEIPAVIPARPVAARARHHLFLGVKEALNNAVRHSHAREILFHIELDESNLYIVITDDGCGFDLEIPSDGNGLTNLSERLNRLDGRCEISSRPGTGTIVRLICPLDTHVSTT